MAGYDAPVSQFQAARRGLAALTSGGVANRLKGRGARLVTAGVYTPQVFTNHPRLLLPNPNEVGIADIVTNEPGLITPAGWDGEQTAAAPPITKTV